MFGHDLMTPAQHDQMNRLLTAALQLKDGSYLATGCLRSRGESVRLDDRPVVRFDCSDARAMVWSAIAGANDG